ncbi:formyltransferase family protein [Acidimicrobiia bacterium]|nr:formyltransferase family protein [Acidimicrobiia bacterium]
MKINILCDNENSWFWKTSKEFIHELEQLGNQVNVCKQESELIKADISAFISCNKIVSASGLNKSLSNIVCHPSDLPKGKGFSPIAWEILNGANFLTFTLFEADEKVDNGNIYKKVKIELKGTELSKEIKALQAKTTYSMILEYIKNYPVVDSYQQVGESTYYKRRYSSNSEIDLNKTIHEQFNLFRIVDNELYPAFFLHQGKKYILKIFEEEN